MPSISVMLKPASGRCNLQCKYCFYHSLTQARGIDDYGIMEISTAKRVIDASLNYAGSESVYFTFQGGEPLLAGKEFFRQFVDYVKKANKVGAKVFYALQTNGTLIDSEWIELFKQNGFLIGLSLDGDEVGNKFRVDFKGNSVFDKVLQNAHALQKAGVDFNIVSVVTAHSAQRIERIYEYFKSQDFRYLQFIPCLRPFGDKSPSELYMDSKQYSKYLAKLFELYLQDYKSGNYVSVRHLDNTVSLYLSGSAEQCGMVGHCARQFVVEANGNVYPCDFYCLDEWLLGNINDSDFVTLSHLPKAIGFLRNSLNISEDCKKCKYFAVCRGGGCKRNRDSVDYCEAYKEFFDKYIKDFEAFAKGEK
ncbi:MAG: radical SAM protein [Clostridia bacterium]|nr:radical SAM protein [Clostridia bacterium]